jgi:hypothetical protein
VIAMASPMPLLDPVTNAILPFKLKSTFSIPLSFS